MRKIAVGLVCMVLAALSATVYADTLYLKSGDRVSGYFEGGSARIVKFRGPDGQVKDYDILSVERLQFGDAQQASSPAAPAGATAPAIVVEPPRLMDQRTTVVPLPPSGNASVYVIPTGTKITIRMVDSIDSERHKAGAAFVAVLDEPLMLDTVQVAARGSDVRGRISTVSAAARGNSGGQLGLELTNLFVNGVSYALTTSEYNEVADEKNVQAGRRAVGGAGVGALIGAIAGGGRGALIGAGVGGGAGVASAVLTKGEKLNIPAETKLQFTLRTPLVVAGK